MAYSLHRSRAVCSRGTDIVNHNHFAVAGNAHCPMLKSSHKDWCEMCTTKSNKPEGPVDVWGLIPTSSGAYVQLICPPKSFDGSESICLENKSSIGLQLPKQEYPRSSSAGGEGNKSTFEVRRKPNVKLRKLCCS